MTSEHSFATLFPFLIQIQANCSTVTLQCKSSQLGVLESSLKYNSILFTEADTKTRCW